MSLGAIVECSPCENQYLSSIFLVPKPDGSKRFILNLKQLNRFISTSHFKLEDIRTVLKLVNPGYYMGKLDLKNAYFLIPISCKDRKYLRFVFKDVLYEFTCLPFGLNTAPYVFTKVMKPVVSFLRAQGFISCIYLDDILCLGDSFDQCKSNLECSLQLLEELGFIINSIKSSLQPKQTCQYLGFHV